MANVVVCVTSQVTEWSKQDEKLMQCVRKKDIDKIQSLLKKGVTPVKLDPEHGITWYVGILMLIVSLVKYVRR